MVTLLAQILDTVYWYTYCRFTGSVAAKCIILTVYSSVCISSSLTFFVIWMQSDEFSRGESADGTPTSEWMGLLFTVLGFLSQSAHGAVIYMQIKDFDGYVPLIEEGVVNYDDDYTENHVRVRMHL